MLRIVGRALIEGIRWVVSSVAILIAAVWVKLSGSKGTYAVVPVLLAPIVVLDFLHLGGERER